ncbi:hypothetical protein Taro_049616 [Colocasia esculenta]|uniref:Uncharacterized protein n=1 Tax=Colocasia esculenta TaxID=4460 RepID=A0A843XBC5_COLES|nr:hypothetical protein [Colocasia esculenta]
MGQAIHSRNFKKSGFSLVGGVWTKTSVAEGEAIICEAQEVLVEVAEAAIAADVPIEQEDQQPAVAPVVQEQQHEVVSSKIAMDQAATAAEVRAEESVVTRRQIEDIPQDNIEPIMRVSEAIIPITVVASILRDVLESIPSTQGEHERTSESVADVVALGHTDDVVMEDAPIEGEQSIEKEATPQGERTTSTPIDDQFREGIVESASGEEDNDDNVEPVARASNKGKEVAQDIPLLTRKPHRRPRQKKPKINMKPIVERLDEQGKILCSVQSDIASIFISQSTTAKEVGMVRNAVRWVHSELISIKESITALADLMRAQSTNAPPAPPPTAPVSSSGPSRPRQENVGPPGPSDVAEDWPLGLQVVEEEVKLIRYFQLFNDYRYLHNLPEVQLGQFQGVVALLKGRLPSFQRFLFREFHLGHITSEVGKPPLSAEAFLDLNSINLAQEPYAQWVARYTLFVALKKDLLLHQIYYPIKINQFLRFASFGSFTSFKVSLGNDEYGTFIDAQRQLHIKRMLPDMGSSYSITFGAFQAYFEEHECKALPIIQWHASLLSPAFYLPGVFPFVLKEDLGVPGWCFSSSGCEEKTSFGWVCRDVGQRCVQIVTDWANAIWFSRDADATTRCSRENFWRIPLVPAASTLRGIGWGAPSRSSPSPVCCLNLGRGIFPVMDKRESHGDFSSSRSDALDVKPLRSLRPMFPAPFAATSVSPPGGPPFVYISPFPLHSVPQPGHPSSSSPASFFTQTPITTAAKETRRPHDDIDAAKSSTAPFPRGTAPKFDEAPPTFPGFLSPPPLAAMPPNEDEGITGNVESSRGRKGKQVGQSGNSRLDSEGDTNKSKQKRKRPLKVSEVELVGLPPSSEDPKELVEVILMTFDALRRRILQMEEAARGKVQAVMKAGTTMMDYKLRANKAKRIGHSMAGIDCMNTKFGEEEDTIAGGKGNEKKQVDDQKLERGNLALERSLQRANEIRVIRGIKDPSFPTGKIFVYDGLYRLHESWVDKGKTGFNVFKYKLLRQAGQPDAFGIWKMTEKWKADPTARGTVILLDLSSSEETLPVCLVNDVDSEKGPAPFQYARTVKYSVSTSTPLPLQACSCQNVCIPGDSNCSCALQNGGDIPYSSDGLLVSRKAMIYECSPSCLCSGKCRNRVTQKGIKLHFEVFRTRDRGWGLRSWNPMRAGSFICEYVGEIIDRINTEENDEEDDEFVFEDRSDEKPFQWNYGPELLGEPSSASLANTSKLPIIISAKRTTTNPLPDGNLFGKSVISN